jgi:hypothetical protein
MIAALSSTLSRPTHTLPPQPMYVRLSPCPHCGSRRRALVEIAGGLRGHCLGCGGELDAPLVTERTGAVDLAGCARPTIVVDRLRPLTSASAAHGVLSLAQLDPLLTGEMVDEALDGGADIGEEAWAGGVEVSGGQGKLLRSAQQGASLAQQGCGLLGRTGSVDGVGGVHRLRMEWSRPG